jgi:hypothetical protein
VLCFPPAGCAEDLFTSEGTGSRRACSPLLVGTYLSGLRFQPQILAHFLAQARASEQHVKRYRYVNRSKLLPLSSSVYRSGVVRLKQSFWPYKCLGEGCDLRSLCCCRPYLSAPITAVRRGLIRQMQPKLPLAHVPRVGRKQRSRQSLARLGSLRCACCVLYHTAYSQDPKLPCSLQAPPATVRAAVTSGKEPHGWLSPTAWAAGLHMSSCASARPLVSRGKHR